MLRPCFALALAVSGVGRSCVAPDPQPLGAGLARPLADPRSNVADEGLRDQIWGNDGSDELLSCCTREDGLLGP